MTDYTAKNITVLEGLDPVRKRPGMYIGGVGSSGLHHLIWEILDNAVDEAMNGHASSVTITVHRDGCSVTVVDDGRGMPVDVHPQYKKSALELIFCTLHAGGKFDETNYKTAGGLHGVGASVVNALSSELTVAVRRGGSEWQMKFHQGIPTGKLVRKGGARGTGTSVYFRPDPTVFPKTEFSTELIRERLETVSFLHRGLKATFIDEGKDEKVTFVHEQGVVDYLAAVVQQRRAHLVHDVPFSLIRENGCRLELALQWTESTDEHLRSYVNGIPTGSGGTHENGIRAGLVKAVRNYVDTHGLAPRGLGVTAEDIREGLVGIVSVFLADPQFQGQTKDRLNNPELQSIVDGFVRPALEQWLHVNRTSAEQIVGRIVLAARAREASRAASASVSRRASGQGRSALPGKLSDCTIADREQAELFVVEGDSAGGSAKQGRDREHQAVLPLRGKVLNTEGTAIGKVLENKELSDLVTALGCGVGKTFDLARLRYGRIVILADADADGQHITTLLLTFFYRHLPELIRAGRVFVAVPPLYRMDIAKETFWAVDDQDRDRILKEHRGRQVEITRFKGLGEMMPSVLWETTLSPASRRLLQVRVSDQLTTDRVVAELMGRDSSARFKFIMQRADQAEDLDL